MCRRHFAGVAAGLMIIALTSGCTETHFGVYPNQTSSFPARPVSVAQAVESAQPFLDESFAMRHADHPERSDDWGESRVFVTLKRDEYYVVKENYPHIMQPSYLAHAVRVHAETGVVRPPE